MNIEKLIKQLDLDGIKYQKLEDICDLKQGDGLVKADMSDNDSFPVIGGGNKPMGKYKSSNFPSKTVTVARVGSAGAVNWNDNPFWGTDSCFGLNSKLQHVSTKYVYYYLKDKQEDLAKNIRQGPIQRINKSSLAQYKIPIPPLEIQQEIVNMLDKFTKLEAELEAELEARKKQYEYYRNQLLTFGENAEGGVNGSP